MSLTSDHTTKIKNAVKAKLVEIGAYVDDQLSDYVMIMITNKKSEKQMTEDLELFLGGIQQAASFSSWLHAMIKKLNDPVPNSSSTSSSSSTSHNHHHHKKSSNSVKHSKSNAKNSSTQINPHVTTESDELAIQIDTNEFNEDFNEDHEKKQSSNKKELKSVEKPKKIDSEPIKIIPESPVKEVIQPAVLKAAEQATDQPKKDLSESVIKEEKRSARPAPIFSQIGAVINQNIKKDKEEDEDDEDMSKGRRQVASVIKVSDRKYSVPKSMQPNKKILLTALDAANSSVQTKPAFKESIADQKLREIRSRRFDSERSNGRASGAAEPKLELFSSHYKKKDDDENRSKRLRGFNQDKRQAVLTSDGMEPKTDRRTIVTSGSDRRQVQINTTDATAPTDIMMDTMDEEKTISNSDDNQAGLNSEPAFIVTLTGLNDEKFLKNLNKTPNKRTVSDMNEEEEMSFANELDYDEEEELMDADAAGKQEADGDKLKKKLVRCTFWPMCDKGEHCPFLHPNKPCQAFPSCTFGQQCHYLHPSCRFDGFCTRLDCTYTHVIKKPAAPVEVPPVKVEQAGEKQAPAAETNGSATSNGAAPKITINNIQPSIYKNYGQSENQSGTAVAANGGGGQLDQANGKNFSLNSTSSIRMPRAAVSSPYFKGISPAFPFSSNQYSLINRTTNPSASLTINCKYANMCKNPKCIYVHPNLPQKSQLKWTALSNATNLNDTQPNPVAQPELKS